VEIVGCVAAVHLVLISNPSHTVLAGI